MTPLRDLIVRMLRRPEEVLELSMADWDLLIRQGRSTNLLAKLGDELGARNILHLVPLAPRQHLRSAVLMAQRQNEALQWEVKCIRNALASIDAKTTLLKGAAYVTAGLKVARGRTFSDVDILVPKNVLEQTELGLRMHGWQGADYDEYDQRYYRRWMHEIPPMRHLRRGTTIDVHHSILPETARIKINTQALFEELKPLPENEGMCTLPPADMFLHSATHLFHEGEFEKGLRDLFDLDSLLNELGTEHQFWDQLLARARVLGLTRPLFYALRYATGLLGTTVPVNVVAAAQVGSPSPLVLRVMDWCYSRAFVPAHHSTDSMATRVARFALYIRSHWIRMPMHLLVYHLGRKLVLLAQSNENSKPIEDVKTKEKLDAGRVE